MSSIVSIENGWSVTFHDYVLSYLKLGKDVDTDLSNLLFETVEDCLEEFLDELESRAEGCIEAWDEVKEEEGGAE